MATMKDIRLRIRSVQSTMQITRAMQLVASSKLRQARQRMEDSRPYLETASETINAIAAHHMDEKIEFLSGRPVKKRCLVVIAGDRGLAGSYNANIFKLIESGYKDVPYCVLPIGRKAKEHYQNLNIEIIEPCAEKAENLPMNQCRAMADALIEGFRNGSFDEVRMCYTGFVSVLTQQAKEKQLLPVKAEPGRKQMIFEPSAGKLLDIVLPDYMAGMIYAAACDSTASEQAARRVAMDAATKNASEMIDNLNLRYNRARQAAITQEITEIVAGSENGEI